MGQLSAYSLHLSPTRSLSEYRHHRRGVIGRRASVDVLLLADAPQEGLQRADFGVFTCLLERFLYLLWELVCEVAGFLAGNALA